MFRAFLFSLTLALSAAPAVALVETRVLTLTGHTTVVDVYTPAVAPPRAIAVIAHGFTRSRAQHVGLAEGLAEAGFLVAVPNLPHAIRHKANANAIVALVAAIVAERKPDTLPVVLIGTSAGGLAALLATDRVPQLALWIGARSRRRFWAIQAHCAKAARARGGTAGTERCTQCRRQCAADRRLVA